MCCVIQETILGFKNLIAQNGYTIKCFSPVAQPTPGSRLAILAIRSAALTSIVLNTTLQAIACRVGLEELIIVCNIYIDPKNIITQRDLELLIDQLPPHFLILGDCHAKHQMWGNDACDDRGRVIEQLLLSNDINLLNTGEATRFHSATNSSTAIDLSISSPAIYPSLQWKPLSDLCGSDHYPIIISKLDENPVTREANFILRKPTGLSSKLERQL